MNILYECEFCGEIDSDKKYIAKHENECVSNPDLNIQACENCELGSISADVGELTNIKCDKKRWTFNVDASKCPDWKRKN
jgi:hypothetical protein